MMETNKPLLALTMGDPAGSGAELLTRAAADRELTDHSRLLVVGDAWLMEKALAITGVPLQIRGIGTVMEAVFEPGVLDVLDLKNVDRETHQFGVVDPMCGKAAYDFISRAHQLCSEGTVGAMVTSAINKESLNKAGYHFDGHTGLLSHLCGVEKVTMMLVADGLRICHVSTHVSLAEAISRVSRERILDVLEIAITGIKGLGIEAPKLAVAGLNPHAGEDGLFGTEEIDTIQPAIQTAVERGWQVTGPYAGDTVFFRAWQGEFDGVVAMYHDQGHIAAKMLGIWNGVNVTLGLPIIRTSVEHGTDFANAGKGSSDPRSLKAAIQLAAQMANQKSKP